MGSLETGGISSKRDHSLLRSASVTARSFNDRQQNAFGQRAARSRFARLLFFKKLDYVPLICTVAVFLFFIILLQMLWLGPVVEKSGGFLKLNEKLGSPDLLLVKEFNGLDFGEDIKFEPSKLLAKFQKDATVQINASATWRSLLRFGYRKPKLAMVKTTTSSLSCFFLYKL